MYTFKSLGSILLLVAIMSCEADVKVIVDMSEHRSYASSYVIGTQRNMVQQDIQGPGGINDSYAPLTYFDLIQSYADITPRFGQKRKIFRMHGSLMDGVYQEHCVAEPRVYPGFGGYHFQDHFGSIGPYPYDDIRYFHEEAEHLNADMIVNINVATGTVAEAKALVEYFQINGLLDHVAFFEMGNELGGHWQIGHHESNPLFCTPTDYAHHVKPFIEAMKSVDPEVKIAACGSYSNNWRWLNCAKIIEDSCHLSRIPTRFNYKNVITALFEVLGDQLDFIAYHGYSIEEVIKKEDVKCLTENGKYVEADIEKRAPLFLGIADYAKIKFHVPAMRLVDSLRREYGIEKNINLVNTEFGTEIFHPEKFRHTMTQAIYSADHILTAFQEDHFAAVNYCLYHYQYESPITGTRPDFEDNIFFSLDGKFKKPIYYVHKLIAENMGSEVVAHEFQGDIPYIEIQACKTNERIQYKKIDLVPTRDSDGSIRILIVNRSMEDLSLSLVVPSGGTFIDYVLKSISGEDFLTTETEIYSKRLNHLKRIMIPKLSVNVLICSSDKRAK